MSDNPWWLNNALVDVSKLNRFPDDDPGDWAAKIRAEAAKEKWTPLLPPDYYSKNPAVNTALSTLLGPLPWLRDPDKPQERMQLWPERMTRSALTLPEDVLTGRTAIYDPETGHVNPEFIDRVQDMSGLIMSGTAFSAPRGSTGAGPTRPPKVAEKKATFDDWASTLEEPVSKGELVVKPKPESVGDRELSLDEFMKYVRDPGIPEVPEQSRRSFLRGMMNTVLSAPLRSKVATYAEKLLTPPTDMPMSVKAGELFKHLDQDLYIAEDPNELLGLIEDVSPKFRKFLEDNGLRIEEAPVSEPVYKMEFEKGEAPLSRTQFTVKGNKNTGYEIVDGKGNTVFSEKKMMPGYLDAQNKHEALTNYLKMMNASRTGGYRVVHGKTGEVQVQRMSKEDAQVQLDELNKAGDPNEAIVHFDPKKFKNIEEETGKIMDEYDREIGDEGPEFVSPIHKQLSQALETKHDDLKRKYGDQYLAKMSKAERRDLDELFNRVQREQSPTWDKYDLFGDDDVDYHGTHIQAFVDALKNFVRAVSKKKDVTLGAGPTNEDLPLPVALASEQRRAPTFFTGLERELLSTKRGENAAPESGTMADWQEYLGKRVKPDEMKWLLRPESVDPKQRFSRQEIAERVAANKPQEHWKGETDKDPMSIQHDFASDVLDKWRSSPPIFRAEPIAAGYSNIIDQHGYIAERHVSNMETKGRIMDLDKIVDEYKKSLEPLSTPEATANAADRRMQAEDDLFQLSLDVASNHMPKENVVYGPEDYPSYTLPGGENYREVVVTLPEPAHDPQIIRDYYQLENDIKYGDAALERANSELHNVENALRTAREQPADVRLRNAAALQKLERDKNTYQSRREQLTEQIDLLEKQQQEMEPAYTRSVEARNNRYTSSHWEEKNALAHARMDDRNIPGIGKTLTLQEMQSDWLQAGQKNKFVGDPSLIKLEQVKEARKLQDDIGESLTDLIHQRQPQLGRIQAESLGTDLLQSAEHSRYDVFFTPEERALAKQWVEAGDHFRRLSESYGDQKAVPDAPFKATWPDMMLKRLLRKAIDEGYDAISWVPGAEHARRYKQEVQATKLRWYPEDGGLLEAEGLGSRPVTGNILGKDIKTRADLEKVLGKPDQATQQDIVSQLMDAPGDRIRMINLDEPRTFYTQRGRRMQSFYDKQLVDKMNAIVGKYGAKVEKTPLKNDAEVKQLYEKEARDQYERWDYEDLDPTRQKQVREDAAKKYGIQEVFVVKLNDKMRRDVQSKGFPLFSGGLISVDHNPFDYDWNKSKAADLTNRTIMRGDWQPQKMTGDEWMRSLQNNSVPGSNRP